MNYYNENDPKAAEWLRELVECGEIPDGRVDVRSICDVTAADLAGFTQCHFFAGIGGWSYALRLAGWPESKPVWTGSCPCQPFSSAGKGRGELDERHLWPAFFNLIRQCRPHVVFGEQVASAIGHGWLDGISSDLEGEGYACGATVLGAHSVGAPHIRKRLYWVANAASERWNGSTGMSRANGRSGIEASRWMGDTNESKNIAAKPGQQMPGSGCNSKLRDRGSIQGIAEVHSSRLGDTDCSGSQGREQPELPECSSEQIAGPGGASGGMGDTESNNEWRERKLGQVEGRNGAAGGSGAWSNYDLIPCRDGKSRRVKSGLQCLAHGIPNRVGLLRGYGNAIVPQAAKAFIESYLDLT